MVCIGIGLLMRAIIYSDNRGEKIAMNSDNKMVGIISDRASIKAMLEKADISVAEIAVDGSVYLSVPLVGVYPKRGIILFDEKGIITGAVITESVTLICTGVFAEMKEIKVLSSLEGKEYFLSFTRNGGSFGSFIIPDRTHEAALKDVRMLMQTEEYLQ